MTISQKTSEASSSFILGSAILISNGNTSVILKHPYALRDGIRNNPNLNQIAENELTKKNYDPARHQHSDQNREDRKVEEIAKILVRSGEKTIEESAKFENLGSYKHPFRVISPQEPSTLRNLTGILNACIRENPEYSTTPWFMNFENNVNFASAATKKGQSITVPGNFMLKTPPTPPSTRERSPAITPLENLLPMYISDTSIFSPFELDRSTLFRPIE